MFNKFVAPIVNNFEDGNVVDDALVWLLKEHVVVKVTSKRDQQILHIGFFELNAELSETKANRRFHRCDNQSNPEVHLEIDPSQRTVKGRLSVTHNAELSNAIGRHKPAGFFTAWSIKSAEDMKVENADTVLTVQRVKWACVIIICAGALPPTIVWTVGWLWFGGGSWREGWAR